MVSAAAGPLATRSPWYRVQPSAALKDELESYLHDISEFDLLHQHGHMDDEAFTQSMAFYNESIESLVRELDIRELLQSSKYAPSAGNRSHALRATIDRIKEYVSIPFYLEQRGYALRKAGSNFKTLCPIPDHQERTPSFTVYPDSHWYCYGCNRGGDVITLDRLVTADPDFRRSVERLGKMARIESSIQTISNQFAEATNSLVLTSQEEISG